MTESASQPLAKSPRKRGRPAQLSRDKILDVALKLLAKGPGEVTISGVARALKTAPMSLYTHIDNRDDLLLGVANRVLAQLQFAIDEEAPWQEQARQWARQLNAHMAHYPQVVSLLGEQAMPAQWLRVHAVLIRILQQAGFSGEALAHAARWLAQLVITEALFNGHHATRVELGRLQEAMALIEPADRDTLNSIMPFLDQGHPLPFDFVLDRALASLETLR